MQTEVHTQLTESLVWIKGHHQVQAGFQLPDWSRRGFFDRTNFNGTYYFSGLDTYAVGRPYRSSSSRERRRHAFSKSRLERTSRMTGKSRSGLSASFGIRYDWQNYFHDDE